MKISIIVPVYKTEKYLEECIKSILAQTYTDFELILIDDGSPDNSGNICDHFAQMDQRIRVLHKPNQGVSAARNNGLDMAKGEYICFVDSDDCIDENYLSILSQDMHKGGMTACQLNHTGKTALSADKDVLRPEEAQISCFSAFGMGGFAWGKLFDTEIIRLNKLRFEQDLAICEDLLFVIQYLRYATEPVVWNHSSLYYYRPNQNGAVKKRFLAHENFNNTELTEITALERSQAYLLDEAEIERAWNVRTVKAAVNTIRTMTANHVYDHEKKKRLLKIVRENVFLCLKSRYLTKNAKLSVFACACSPTMELKMWILHN